MGSPSRWSGSPRKFDQFEEVSTNAVHLQLHALPYDLGDNRHKGPHNLVRLAKRIAKIVTARFRMEETRTSGDGNLRSISMAISLAPAEA